MHVMFVIYTHKSMVKSQSDSSLGQSSSRNVLYGLQARIHLINKFEIRINVIFTLLLHPRCVY